MNILVVATEIAPIAKSGGLADVVSSLAIEWKKTGHNPIIIIPKYSSIDTNKYNFQPTNIILVVPMGYWHEYATLWKGSLPNSDVEIYLLEHNEYFDRKGIYGEDFEYKDNDRRFIFLSRAAFEAAKALDFKPDVIHAHDYHTAFTMPFLKTHYRNDSYFSGTAGIFTIHNLAYQGKFAPEPTMEYSSFGMNNFYPGSWFEYYGSTNFMKTGIAFADKITTVSPTYSKEIRSEYFGEGLHNVLNWRGADLIGILNGVDYSAWSPEIDPLLPLNYSHKSLSKKQKLKHDFLRANNIYEDLDIPLIGLISRMTEQKGIDLIINKLESFLWNSQIRVAVIGSGEQHYENYFNYIKHKYPFSSIVYIGYNEELAHNIFAASDFFFVPSRFEPCGLTQMYAMRYGSLPIVRSTGGLADTVHEFIPQNKTGNGFVFWNYNAEDFAYAVSRALDIYYIPDMINAARKNAMTENLSSSRSANEYIKIFKWAKDK